MACACRSLAFTGTAFPPVALVRDRINEYLPNPRPVMEQHTATMIRISGWASVGVIAVNVRGLAMYGSTPEQDAELQAQLPFPRLPPVMCSTRKETPVEVCGAAEMLGCGLMLRADGVGAYYLVL